MMTVKEAAAQCRKYPHGCRLYQDALQVLKDHYAQAAIRRSVDATAAFNPSLDQLWSWVNGYLLMEEASHGSTPLG